MLCQAELRPSGAPGRTRTCNLSLRRALLFLLSYGRTLRMGFAFAGHWPAKMNVKRSLSRRSLVERATGIEPATPGLEGQCSASELRPRLPRLILASLEDPVKREPSPGGFEPPFRP